MATSLAGSHTLFGPIVSCPGELSDHQGVDACFTMETSLSRSGTFRAPPLIEKTPGYQNSENFLINEELNQPEQNQPQRNGRRVQKK